jgi:hypothetical protein
MGTGNNVVKINSLDQFIAAAKEAKKYNIQAVWDIEPDLLSEIMLSDVLDEIYGDAN